MKLLQFSQEHPRRKPLLERTIHNEFWCKESNENPFGFAPVHLPCGFAITGDVEMYGGPNAEDECEDAAVEEVPSSSTSRLRDP